MANSMPEIPSVEEMGARIQATKEMIETDEEFARELREGRPSGNPIQLGPRLPSADDWAKEQVAGAKNKAAKWLKNTVRPRKNFKEEALKATSRERYNTSMEEVIREDRWAGGMELVDESETMKIIEARGSSAYSSGVADREAKIRRRVEELHADRLALAHVIDDMPVSTEEEREAKMVANVRGLKDIGKRRRGGA